MEGAIFSPWARGLMPAPTYNLTWQVVSNKWQYNGRIFGSWQYNWRIFGICVLSFRDRVNFSKPKVNHLIGCMGDNAMTHWKSSLLPGWCLNSGFPGCRSHQRAPSFHSKRWAETIVLAKHALGNRFRFLLVFNSFNFLGHCCREFRFLFLVFRGILVLLFTFCTFHIVTGWLLFKKIGNEMRLFEQ